MGLLKWLPVVSKDLLEDIPVPRGGCHHRIAPSGGDQIVAMERWYHASAASSTPHPAFTQVPSPDSLILDEGELSGSEKCIFLYDGHTRKQNCSRNSARRNQRNSLRNSCALYLALERLVLSLVRCFCVVQKQKGVADATIEAGCLSL